jgi:hypothetical protein
MPATCSARDMIVAFVSSSRGPYCPRSETRLVAPRGEYCPSSGAHPASAPRRRYCPRSGVHWACSALTGREPYCPRAFMGEVYLEEVASRLLPWSVKRIPYHALPSTRTAVLPLLRFEHLPGREDVQRSVIDHRGGSYRRSEHIAVQGCWLTWAHTVETLKRQAVGYDTGSIGRLHASLRGQATETDANRVEATALGTKWAEDRFCKDPEYSAFTLDMVWIDPAIVPNAKKRETMRHLICESAVTR